jgi:hypothetical protein
MISVKRRRIETPIGLAATAILAKFDNIFGHDLPPEFHRCGAN